MTELYEQSHFTRDAASVEFHEDADGVTVEGGERSVDWSEVETVRVDNPPTAAAFDSKEFYRIPATVARPIEQPYHYGEDELTLKKPREELKKAAWSLDNAPFTLGHPDTGMVKDVDDVHGFWDDTQYVDGLDDLDSFLHVPVGDEEAKEYIEDNGDVSVGFYNRVARTDDYDGVVGGSDDESDVDGYQTDLLFDHVAAVQRGRCPSDKGCGLSTDSGSHGHVSPIDSTAAEAFKRDTRTTHSSDEGESDTETSTDMKETTDAPSGIHVADGNWFAVGPDEHPDDSTEYADDAKFPVDSCVDIKDAWNLRGTGDIDISEDTLEERIRRAADAKDCSLPDSAETDALIESAKRYSVCGSRDVMDERYYACGDCSDNSDEETDTNTMSEDNGIEFGIDDLSVDAALAKVEAQHEGVSERLDGLRENEDKAEAADEAAEELDVEVDELPDAVALKDERIEELEEKVDELQRPDMKEDAEFIAEHTDRFGEDAEEVMEELDEDPETVADKRDLVEDLVEDYDETTANAAVDDSGGSATETTDSSTYEKTPW